MLSRVWVGLAGAFVLVILLACKGKEKPATSSPFPITTPSPIATKTLGETVEGKPTLASAVQYAATFSNPKPNEHSDTTILVGLWAMKRMQWRDIAVDEDETNYALAKKDIDAARGKRLCVSGTIVQIQSNKGAAKGTDEGIILSGAGNLFYFITVGSSGDVVAQSWARICAVITDEYDYSNSSGGVGHALDMVGMFDLPQNKAIRGTISADSLPKAN